MLACVRSSLDAPSSGVGTVHTARGAGFLGGARQCRLARQPSASVASLVAIRRGCRKLLRQPPIGFTRGKCEDYPVRYYRCDRQRIVTARRAQWSGNIVDVLHTCPLDLTIRLLSGILPLVLGAVAQLGERINRTDEVRGSNPLSSTLCVTHRSGKGGRRSCIVRGAVAQLGARLTGSQKVRGSSPLSSTFLLLLCIVDIHKAPF